MQRYGKNQYFGLSERVTAFLLAWTMLFTVCFTPAFAIDAEGQQEITQEDTAIQEAETATATQEAETATATQEAETVEEAVEEASEMQEPSTTSENIATAETEPERGAEEGNQESPAPANEDAVPSQDEGLQQTQPENASDADVQAADAAVSPGDPVNAEPNDSLIVDPALGEEKQDSIPEEQETTETIEETAVPLGQYEVNEENYAAQSFCDEIGETVVSVEAPALTFPNGTTMHLEEVSHEDVIDALEDALDDEILSVTAVDITFKNANGEEIEPLGPISVKMQTKEASDEEDSVVCHIAEEKAEIIDSELEESEKEGSEEQETVKELVFQSDTFSVYATVSTAAFEERILTDDGNSYRVELDCQKECEIPRDAQIEVKEISAEDGAQYREAASSLLGMESSEVSYLRLFDISITKNGEEIQPKEGTKVDVTISLDDMGKKFSPSVIHFGETAEVVTSGVDDSDIKFQAEGFSVYAIIDFSKESNIESEALLQIGGYYFKNEHWVKNGRDLIKKTDDISQAAIYYFEGNEDEQYLIYCLGPSSERLYVKFTRLDNTGGGLKFTTDVNDASLWEITKYAQTSNKQFSTLYNGTRYFWNQHHGSNGNGFGTTATNNDPNNALVLQNPLDAVDDPYEINGKSFGLAFSNTSNMAAALKEEIVLKSGVNVFAAERVTIRPNVLDSAASHMLLSSDNIFEWTFHNVSKNIYYITAQIDGVEKYMSLSSSGVSLVETPTAASEFVISVGTDGIIGHYQIHVGNLALGLNGGNANKGFTALQRTNANTNISFVSKIDIVDDDDFTTYSATKVSVSDTERLRNGQKVVIYTRIWNESREAYEFFVLDHNGELIRCYESGDRIEWISGPLNTTTLLFIEYFYEGTGEPNYYYDLQNLYSGKYIAPKMTSNDIWSNTKIGVNLNGRRWGDNYSSIIAWDDVYYDYAGLKINEGSVESDAWAECDDFYFAIFNEYSEEDIETIPTIDNNEHGITMKMVDFNGAEASYRNTQQTALLGLDTNKAGLVNKYLEDNGYPNTNPSNTGKPLGSLESLFGSAQEVNHLFIESIYNESGYFEFDSTKNFAYLGDSEDFTVYEQLVSINRTNQSLGHGQFMPYNWLVNPVTGEVLAQSTVNPVNRTTRTNQELDDADPRKGEMMYGIPNSISGYPGVNTQHPYDHADYFFGMEMEASMFQTPNGLDAWGHDIIFEFSGDDDFWLFVDGNLVLDLGGVHSALTGSVNFRTGEVRFSKRGSSAQTTTNLRTLFKESYQAKNPSATNAEVTAYLDSVFVEGGTVFKEYTLHKIKIFYMERGAGASNLYMRFNLEAAKEGYVTLSKKIEGAGSADYNLAKFYYQFQYQTDDGEWHLMEQKTGGQDNAHFVGKNQPAVFLDSYTPIGSQTEYQNVFVLEPNQEIEFKLPDGVVQYKITECGLSPTIYSDVKINGNSIVGTDEDGDGRNDYSTGELEQLEHPRIEYINVVSADALRTLTITKKLYKEDGETLLSSQEDSTTFNFRLYLGDEDQTEIPLAGMQKYYVKNENFEYCTWDVANQKFISTGKSQFSQLTDRQKERATFTTSANGSISKIPAGYSIEVQNLLVGSKFKVEERAHELPKGYTLRSTDGYTRINGSYYVGGAENEGTVRENNDPAMEVRNQRGFGLTAEKVWSDIDFTSGHDDIYFAVYAKGELLEDTVRVLRGKAPSVYWYFLTLKDECVFSDYVVREVLLSGDIVVGEGGEVTGFSSVTPIEDNGSLTINAIATEDNASHEYTYHVSYAVGAPYGVNDNLRKDTVTNHRNGINIMKTDLNGSPVAGAQFALTDESGATVGQSSYESDASGWITTAYLPNGKYYLVETKAPSGYIGLQYSVEFTVDDGTVSVSPYEGGSDWVVFDDSNADDPVITVKNKLFSLKAVKIDGEDKANLQGATFAIYRQVMTVHGTPKKDYFPLIDNLTSDENGIIMVNMQTIGQGTFYLAETAPPPNYVKMEQDICFSISATGDVLVKENPNCVLLENDTGAFVEYTIKVSNFRGLANIQIIKTDDKDPVSALEGAEFKLYGMSGGVPESEPIYSGLVSNENGVLMDGSAGVFSLHAGDYILEETKAPHGYQSYTEPIVLHVGEHDVSCSGALVLTQSNGGVVFNEEEDMYSIFITNKPASIIPPTGVQMSMGIGVLLVFFGCSGLVILFTKMRRKKYLEE